MGLGQLGAPRLVLPGRKLHESVTSRSDRPDVVVLASAGALVPGRARVRFGVGWVACSVPFSDPDTAFEWIAGFGVVDLVEQPGGRHFYRSSARGPNGVQVLWNRPDSHLVHFILPATHLETLPLASVRRLLADVLARDGHLSRLDLSLDDLDRVTNIPQAAQAVVDGDVATRAKRVRMMVDAEVGTGVAAGRIQGVGFYLGTRVSESFLRVYDKALEVIAKARARRERFAIPSDDEGNRWELELHDERATEAARRLVQLEVDQWPALTAGLFRAFADFRDRSSGLENITRADLLPWWSEFLAGAEVSRLAVAKPAQTLAGLRAYFREQLAPSLAVLVESLGEDIQYLFDLVEHGKLRWTSRHRAMLL